MNTQYMKYNTTNLTTHNGIRVGQYATEQQGKRSRYIMCKGIHIGEDGKYYAHWQYVSAKTLKPTGKSTSFLKQIEN